MALKAPLSAFTNLAQIGSYLHDIWNYLKLVQGNFHIDGNMLETKSLGEPGSGNVTLTAEMLLNGVIDEDPEGNANWTTDTAANIVAEIPSCSVGTQFRCIVYNDATSASSEAVTLKPGTGVTFHGIGHGSDVVLTEGTDPIVELLFRITNISQSSEAVDCYIISEL